MVEAAKPCVPEPSPNPARILLGFLVPLCAVTPQCPLHLVAVHPVVELVLLTSGCHVPLS